MPKIRTSKTAAKRILKKTKSGKLLRRKSLAQHLVHRKSKRTVKSSGNRIVFEDQGEKKLKALAPYA